jgi:hypothetical protein
MTRLELVYRSADKIKRLKGSQVFLFLAFIGLLFILTSSSFAAEVTNIRDKMMGNTLVITFDVTGEGNERETEVTAIMLVDGEEYKPSQLKGLKGDFGKVKIGKNKRISWNIPKDFPGFNGHIDWRITPKERVITAPAGMAYRAESPRRQEAKRPTEIRRDGRFIAYEDGTVLDTRTNLMWAKKDNGSDITWRQAKSHSENYRGGGYTDWRMPTQGELERLYDSNKSYKATQCNYQVKLTELIQLSAGCPWASEAGDSTATGFCFTSGYGFSHPQSLSADFRALPVRNVR